MLKTILRSEVLAKIYIEKSSYGSFLKLIIGSSIFRKVEH
jgi:hypothetical protein